MCGIAGIVGGLNNKDLLIQKMLDKQKHRGPDATKYWQDANVCLGHNRLSIIDLSELANQPFLSNCERYVIVFNGEIYNYQDLKNKVPEYSFRTQSDTEVLLALYIKFGKKMLEYINGMFAFAIWDKFEKKVFAARDRFGIKPFYYALKNDILYFSSEIKTLWTVGINKEKNQKVWANYLIYGAYGLPNETFWNNIHQLPAGHYFEYTLNGNIQPVMWYDFVNRITTINEMSLQELKKMYFNLLNDAIALRFVADVPLGMNVSGGLDSSTLIALVNENLPSKKSIEAFTFYSNNNSYDELPWVKKLLQSTPYHLNLVLLEHKNIPQLIQEVSYYQDEPFGGFPTLAYSLLFKEAREKGIIVLLDGQGMDEAWAGYDYYHNQSNNIIQGTATSPVKPEVLSNEFVSVSEKEMYPKPFNNHLQDLQYRDLFYTKIPRALRFNDRISMMHSTELREPFLDYRLVELAFAQPNNLKFKNNQTKWLLRDLIKEKLGNTIALAPKRALQTPQREWLANELKDYSEQSIEQFSLLDFVDAKKVKKIWKNYLIGDQENSFYIWQRINCVSL